MAVAAIFTPDVFLIGMWCSVPPSPPTNSSPPIKYSNWPCFAKTKSVPFNATPVPAIAAAVLSVWLASAK